MKKDSISKQQMRRGLLEFAVLLILKARPTHVQNILDLLKETEFETVQGTLYPLLRKMCATGLLEQSLEETDAAKPLHGARNYFFMTEKGERRLKEMGRYWKTLNETLEKLSAPLT